MMLLYAHLNCEHLTFFLVAIQWMLEFILEKIKDVHPVNDKEYEEPSSYGHFNETKTYQVVWVSSL